MMQSFVIARNNLKLLLFSMKAPNSQIFEMLDQAIAYANEKEDTTEKEEDIELLEQTKKDIDR